MLRQILSLAVLRRNSAGSSRLPGLSFPTTCLRNPISASLRWSSLSAASEHSSESWERKKQCQKQKKKRKRSEHRGCFYLEAVDKEQVQLGAVFLTQEVVLQVPQVRLDVNFHLLKTVKTTKTVDLMVS